MPRTRVHPDGRPLASGLVLRLVLAVDAVLHGRLAFGVTALALDDALPWSQVAWVLVYVALVLLTDLGAVGLRAGAMVWRRRLAIVAVVGVLWRDGPFRDTPWQWIAILDAALIWIALLAEGRRVARSVAEATGEHVLSVDPTRPDR